MTKKRARLTEDNDPLTSTDKVLAGFQQLSQSTSQGNDPECIRGHKPLTVGQPDSQLKSQPVGKPASQQVDKSNLRKATFQLQESLLEQLDQLHLQLQLELGKVNAPYKEVIVEEAIVRLLYEFQENRDELVQLLQQRQSLRR